MPKPEDFEVIVKRRPDWDFIQQLPKEMHGFTLREGGELKRDELVLAEYVNEEWRRRLELIYTRETWDYVPIRQVGLLRYRDFRFITRDKDQFAGWIRERLPQLLEETRPDFIPRSRKILEQKGILQWEYADTLPDRIGRFEKFITSRHPLHFLNNSTVILDYVDFSCGDELLVMFNRHRNEYFAETKTRYFPNTMHEFDAKSLEDLEALLREKLEPFLLNFEVTPEREPAKINFE